MIEIHETGKGPARIEAPRLRSIRVSQWLASAGYPLNTRCGQRGLCRGCEVTLLEPATERTIRACQLRFEELSPGLYGVRIPAPSRQTGTLNGVSLFELAGSPPAPIRRPGTGLALDLGTTTVAAALWDLSSGLCLAHGSAPNQQRRFGDNVLSRIDFSMTEESACRDLQRALIDESVMPLLLQLCEECGISATSISEGVAVGNTVMLHTLLGESLTGFASFPFQPVFLGERRIDAATTGFALNFPMLLAPSMGPFVGADITAGAVASGLMDIPEPALLVDFGTNGEILLWTGKELLATATAAGPAFEGGRLNCGGPAAPGSVSSIRWDADAWRIQRLAGPRQTTIAGSAYIDFLAQARLNGWLSPMGRFTPAASGVHRAESSAGSFLQISLEPGLAISEADVAELIQAKAAIGAGIQTLLEVAGIPPSDLSTLFIAGGFGYHLNINNAARIGLIPDIDADRIRVIGNAALGGASLALQCDSLNLWKATTSRVRIIELNQISSFQDHFIETMRLDPLEE